MTLHRWLYLLFPIFIGACAHREIPYAKLAQKIDRDSCPSISYEGTEGEFHYFVYRAGFIEPVAELVGRRNKLFKIRDEEFLNTVSASRKQVNTNEEPKWYLLGIYGHRDFYQDFPPLDPTALPQRAQQVGAGQPEKRPESVDSSD